MRSFAIMLLWVLASSVNAQKYPVSEIPAAVKKGSNAVIRLSEQTFEMKSISNAIYTTKQVVTILNSDGFGDAVFRTTYDKLLKIKRMKLSYFDANGKLLKKVKNGEIEDYNYTSSGSVYDDNRIKFYEPEEYEYPFTIAYEFEFDYRSMVSIPDFNPRYRDKIGVEKASYTVIVPKDYKLRFKPVNGAPEPQKTSGSIDTYTWVIEGLEPYKTEYRGLSANKASPHVLIEPSEFMMEGYKGNLSSWAQYGEWLAKLNAGRDEISEEIKQKIDELILGISDPREKTRRIYKFMQENTRYVSIQLGIGGLQPFDAMNVIDNGYGDCKALSNYTYSLLKYAGVKSNYTVIRAGAGEQDLITDFTNDPFNHVILAVPMEKDTVWLECTSQTAPFNFLGDFTDDRYGLLITDDGKGALVKTPKYIAEQSTQNRIIDMDLDKEGDAAVSVKTISKGIQYDQIYGLIKESSEDQRKYLLNTINLPAFDLGDFDYEEDRSSEDPSFTEKIEMNVRKYATNSGKRMFITPNLLNRYGAKPPKDEERNSPIIIKYSFLDTDTVNIKIPEGYRMEFEMEPYEITSDFGEYRLTYDFNPETNQLTYIRRFQLNAGKYSPETYNKYRSFIRKVVKRDKSKLVLIGST